MKIEAEIRAKLEAQFSPEYLEVLNESNKHSVPEGSESHFKLVVVSRAFEGLSQVKRQQAVYGVLDVEMTGSVHALAQHTYTPDEWAKKGVSPDSPKCQGGN